MSIYNCPCNVRHGQGQATRKKPWRQGKTMPTIL